MTDNHYIYPRVFNVFKPVGITSYDVIRHFKRNLPKGFGKIGHFGTLDPFASGVLLIGITGATKINNMIHDMFPKTYLAIGKLGVKTETGDLTVPPCEIDDGRYLNEEISRLPVDFLECEFNKNFIGVYMQSPHIYSASKYEGKPLHEWARSGVKIQKEQVKRHIHKIEVVRYCFPWLSVRVTVSSGTFVRTLFSDFAKHLGTFGALQGLVRENIGPSYSGDAIKKYNWPKDRDPKILELGKELNEVLPLKEIEIDDNTSKKYLNGISFATSVENQLVWVKNNGILLGMGSINGGTCKVNFNLPRI